MHPGANFDINPIQRARSDRQKRLRRTRRIADQEASARRSALLDRERHEYVRSRFIRQAILSSLPQFHRWDHDRLRGLVDHSNPLVRCTADVTWQTKAKSTVGDRPICRMPAQLHLGQVMVKDLINAQLRPSARVFDWTGRGRHRYANSLAHAVEREGPFVATMDIKSCYQSVDPDALYRLSNLLPTELIRWCLDHRNLSFRLVRVNENDGLDPNTSELKPTGPRGLLQGGPASSALLTALIGHSVTEVRQAYCQSCSDNFAVVGRTPAVVQQAAGELARIVAGYHVGRLVFHDYEVIDARNGFSQLGFDFRLIGNRVRISPNTGNIIKILKRIEERIASVDQTDLAFGPAAFVAEEAVAYGLLPAIDFSEVEEEVEQLWRDQVVRRATCDEPGCKV
jgi:hypothetical protein